jgi:PAS domain S-box-containing protein
MENSVKNILLVEDDSLIAMTQSAELISYGYNVINASKGVKAFSVLKQGEPLIDLILMDINLGEEDGTDIAKAILQEYDIPLIFLSSHTEREVVTKTENISFYGYVVKLSGMIVLDASIKMAIRLHETYKLLRQQKIELEGSEKRYRRLFESAKDGILILEFESGKIVDVNPFLVKMLGYSKETFLEKHLWDISAFKHIDYSKQLYGELQNKEYIRYENIPLETHDEELINVEFVSNVYLVDNAKVIQCNIRDITERVKEELIISHDLKEKAYLIREMKHRTKNSFSMITSLIQMRAYVGSSEMKNILADLASRVRSISDLYTLLEETESFYEVDLKNYLNKVITSMINFTKDIQVTRELVDMTVPTKVAATIGMILVELMTNSIKYAFPNIDKKEVNVELKLNNSMIELVVQDSGIGLSKELVVTDVKPLGFNIVNLLVEELDGTIKYIVEKGTRIEIEFPVPKALSIIP